MFSYYTAIGIIVGALVAFDSYRNHITGHPKNKWSILWPFAWWLLCFGVWPVVLTVYLAVSRPRVLKARGEGGRQAQP